METTRTTEDRFATPADTNGNERSLGSLLKDFRDESTRLFQQEALLIRTEISEKISRCINNSLILGAGALVAFAGVIVLLLAAGQGVSAALIAAGMEANALWLGPLIVGGVVTLIGIAMLIKGKNSLQNESLVPEKTAQSMKENKEWLKNKAG